MNLNSLVFNSSPIISLAKIGYVNLLIDLSNKLVIPQGVFEEITDFQDDDPAVIWIKETGVNFLEKVEIPISISEWNLGKGESEVMAFALENKEYTVVIDDKPARNCAKVFNLKTLGTISIIIKAKELKLIQKIKPLLSKLKDNGFRISRELEQTALKLANEL